MATRSITEMRRNARNLMRLSKTILLKLKLVKLNWVAMRMIFQLKVKKSLINCPEMIIYGLKKLTIIHRKRNGSSLMRSRVCSANTSMQNPATTYLGRKSMSAENAIQDAQMYRLKWPLAERKKHIWTHFTILMEIWNSIWRAIIKFTRC